MGMKKMVCVPKTPSSPPTDVFDSKECNRRGLTTNAETGELQEASGFFSTRGKTHWLEVADGATMNFNEINWHLDMIESFCRIHSQSKCKML